jgi:uncharacterized protein YigE (DUF2233 family)
MRSAFLPFLVLLASCSEAAPVAPSVSACSDRSFEGTRFTVCSEKHGRVEVRTSRRNGAPYRNFAALAAALGKRADTVAFAMNAGMFDERGHAIGLLVEDGRELHTINRRKGGGNFHLLPNGVFLVRRDGRAEIVTSDSYKSSKNIAFATQSGPMLVVGGKLHPSFEPDGQSRYVRNGVGIAPDGTPLFVISVELVSFGKFARLFRDELKARNALYFDGSVSSLWDPASGRQDSFTELGPMVVVLKPERAQTR